MNAKPQIVKEISGQKLMCTSFLLLILKRVESFLHKDVSFVVTESQEGLKEQKCSGVREGAKGTNEETQCPLKQSVLSSDKQRPVTPRPAVLNPFLFVYLFIDMSAKACYYIRIHLCRLVAVEERPCLKKPFATA